MTFFISFMVILSSLLVILSGLWVIVGLIRELIHPPNAAEKPSMADPTKKQNFQDLL
jgi:hypothetical protein